MECVREEGEGAKEEGGRGERGMREGEREGEREEGGSMARWREGEGREG